MATVTKYPIYMYKRGKDPKRVDNKAELDELKNRGWRNRYIWSEYPKAVNDIIVNSKEEEDLLLKANDAAPKVIVDKKTLSAGNTIIADTGDTAPILTEAPLSGAVQVAENLESDKGFEMLGTDGEPIDGLHYPTWHEAQAAQKDLNVNAPGHKARKIAG